MESRAERRRFGLRRRSGDESRSVQAVVETAGGAPYGMLGKAGATLPVAGWKRGAQGCGGLLDYSERKCVPAHEPP
jgi:hypothetical protein